MQAGMKPATELCSGTQAHTFVRGLTVAHLDAVLRADPAAERFLAHNVETELAERAIDATVHRP
jgi:hypothetical protein